MLQRRKITTYGKPSRKPNSDFSAFAQASEQSSEPGEQGNTSPRTISTMKDASTGLAQCSTASKSLPTARETISRSQERPKNLLDDLPPKGAGTERNSNTLDTESRKRRKLTLKHKDPQIPVLFDDNSLQRHIAAGARKESGEATGTESAITGAGSTTNLAVINTRSVSLPSNECKSEDRKQKTSWPIQSRVPTTTKSPARNTSSSSKNHEPKSTRAKKVTSLNKQDNTISSTEKTPPCKTQTAKKGTLQSTRRSRTPPQDDFFMASSLSHCTEGEKIMRGRGSPSSTPPRANSSASAGTTPKQRELWGKLLTIAPNMISPSNLDVPSLRIADQRAQPRQKPNLKLHMRNAGRVEKAELGKRSTRLVDFLITSDGDGGHSGDDFKEEDESSEVELSKSIESEVSKIDDVLTTQTSPSAASQNKRLEPQEPGLAPISQPISSSQGGLKVTYSSVRTYLPDQDLNDAAMLDVPLVPETGFPRKHSWGNSDVAYPKYDSAEDIRDGLDDVQESQGGTMRSIHELRESGGNTRLVGELEAILDDLDERLDSPISARRSSLMSLTSKLVEASTCRMFVDQGLEPRLLAQVNFGHDIIERSLLAVSILQILLHTSSGVFLSQINQARTTNLLIGLLGQTQDLTKQAKVRETNMSKLGQSEYATLCSSVLRSPVWRSLKPPILSGQVLALQCLEWLVRRGREAGYFAEILSTDAISCVAETSLPSLDGLQPLTVYSRICLELAVSILESSTISGAAAIRGAGWTDITLERISAIFPLIADSLNDEYGSLRTLTLRLYLNLTNSNPDLCEAFSKPHVVTAMLRAMLLQFHRLAAPESQANDVHLLDSLVLSLGCLINLAESSDSMRQLVMNFKDKDHSFLETLLQLFMTKRKEAAEAYSEEEAGINVAYGYMSVLLSYLCINKKVRSRVSAHLEGGTLKPLLDAVEEFLHYHRQIDAGTERKDAGEERRASFVSRLQETVDDLKFFG